MTDPDKLAEHCLDVAATHIRKLAEKAEFKELSSYDVEALDRIYGMCAKALKARRDELAKLNPEKFAADVLARFERVLGIIEARDGN